MKASKDSKIENEQKVAFSLIYADYTIAQIFISMEFLLSGKIRPFFKKYELKIPFIKFCPLNVFDNLVIIPLFYSWRKQNELLRNNFEMKSPRLIIKSRSL